MSKRKIVLLTIGQPSTNPRMVKEVDALLNAGYDVKVLYSYWVTWGSTADIPLLEKYAGVFEEIGGNPATLKKTYFWSRILFKTIRQLLPVMPALKKYAIARTTFWLEKAATRYKADLYIAHNLGALPAACTAAKHYKAALGFDAEDYHRGQYAYGDFDLPIVTWIEDNFIPRCNYITAASPLIAKAYSRIFPQVAISVINNVFSLKYLQPEKKTSIGKLSLFWFSQTIGTDRGLETIVCALNKLQDIPVTLHLLGDCTEAFEAQLRSLLVEVDRIQFISPVDSDQVFPIAAQFDIGLSSEIPHCLNRDYCLTNKLFTYLLAGNAIIASDTSAQKNFMQENPGLGLLYKHDDPEDLAAVIRSLYHDPERLLEYKRMATRMAGTTFNWENESRILLAQVAVATDKTLPQKTQNPVSEKNLRL